MTCSEAKNEYGFSAADVYRFRQDTGASMMEAHKHFLGLWKTNRRREMAKLIESGTAEDVRKVVELLFEAY